MKIIKLDIYQVSKIHKIYYVHLKPNKRESNQQEKFRRISQVRSKTGRQVVKNIFDPKLKISNGCIDKFKY